MSDLVWQAPCGAVVRPWDFSLHVMLCKKCKSAPTVTEGSKDE